MQMGQARRASETRPGQSSKVGATGTAEIGGNSPCIFHQMQGSRHHIVPRRTWNEAPWRLNGLPERRFRQDATEFDWKLASAKFTSLSYGAGFPVVRENYGEQFPITLPAHGHARGWPLEGPATTSEEPTAPTGRASARNPSAKSMHPRTRAAGNKNRRTASLPRRPGEHSPPRAETPHVDPSAKSTHLRTRAAGKKNRRTGDPSSTVFQISTGQPTTAHTPTPLT